MISIGRDELLDRVRDALPEPVREEAAIDGSTVLVGGDPGEVVVRITSEEITVSVFTVRWDGPHTPRVCPEPLASLAWHRLPASWTLMTLSGLVDAAIELRRAGFGSCEHCGRTMPPEWMHGQGVCQSCAERDLGVVH